MEKKQICFHFYLISFATLSNREGLSQHFKDRATEFRHSFGDFISAYFKRNFQIPHVKIYQNTNFQRTSPCESKDIPRSLLHKYCKNIVKINIIWYSSSSDLYLLPTLKSKTQLIQNVSKDVQFLHVKNEIIFSFIFSVMTLSNVESISQDFKDRTTKSSYSWKIIFLHNISMIFRFTKAQSIRM